MENAEGGTQTRDLASRCPWSLRTRTAGSPAPASRGRQGWGTDGGRSLPWRWLCPGDAAWTRPAGDAWEAACRGADRGHTRVTGGPAGWGRRRLSGRLPCLCPEQDAPLGLSGSGSGASRAAAAERVIPCSAHPTAAQRSSSSPGSPPSSASVCGSLRHPRGEQVPRAGSRPPFPRGCRSLAVLAGLPRWPQGYRGADGLALSLVSGHTRSFCQDCDGALRCPQEPFATPSPHDFLVCRAFLSGDAAGLRRAACTATEALRGAHSSWFYGRRVYWVSRRAELASLR